jgi:pyruvate dehydrogenase E2 component (dihydrolipoamide acetyltransferase)
MADIVMPRLSDTMEEGTILRWLKRDGEEVARGEELVELETDKATMTYESDLSGILQTVAAEGDTLAVGALIAHIGPQGGDGDAGAPGTTRAPSTRAEEPAAAAGAPVAAGERPVTGGPAAGGGSAAVAGGPPASDGSPEVGRVKASPLARRIARERGIDLQGLSGSGPGGRIVKADVVSPPAGAAGGAAAPRVAAPTASTAALEGVMTAKGETTDVELSRTQQTIARRMAESKATIPDFTLEVEVDMEECVKLRSELKRISGERAQAEAGAQAELGTPTYNDMVVKASALALREYPRANGSYRDGRLQLHSRVNVGVAVAAEQGLIVPTVFDAESKALGEIARETRALAERVRAGTITPPELGGGTFTVSNLGMFGVRSFAAIINPPQAAILSVGSLERRAVVRGEEIVARNTMALTLACDHRILYGADAAQFLGRIRELLEQPAALTL